MLSFKYPIKITIKMRLEKIIVFCFIIFAFSFFSLAYAQTDVYVGDDEVIVETVGDDEEEEINIRIEDETVVENVPASDVQEQQEQQGDSTNIQTQVQTIETAPEQAPDSGPAESIIIIAAITFGFLGAVIFLALMVHSRWQ